MMNSNKHQYHQHQQNQYNNHQHHNNHRHHQNREKTAMEVPHSRHHRSTNVAIPMVHHQNENRSYYASNNHQPHHLSRPNTLQSWNDTATTELYNKKSKAFLQDSQNSNNSSSMKPQNLTQERSASSSSAPKQNCHIFHAFSRCFRFCSKPKDYSDGCKSGGEMDEGCSFELCDPSEILSVNDINLLGQRLPPIAIGNSWKLTFSTTKDGFCLKSLYRRMLTCSTDSPVLIIIQDTKNRVFGVLASNALRISDHFYGTSQSFLFRCNPNFQIYKWNGDNFYFIKGNPDSIIFGSGNGKYGLWLDGDLNKGRTQSCSTFGSPPLVQEEDFIIKTLECWTFGKT